jgi:hypothetical protein
MDHQYVTIKNVTNTHNFIKRHFNFNYELIEADENKIPTVHVLVSPRSNLENDYIIYNDKISIHKLAQSCVTIENGTVNFDNHSALFGMYLLLTDNPINEKIITSDIGLAMRLNQYKYYPVVNLKTGAGDSVSGQELCERLLNNVEDFNK